MPRAPIKQRDLIKEQALDDAVAKVKADGFRTFCIIYETDSKAFCESYPSTPGTIKGLCDRILFVMQGKFF